jgi:hypothetical protein
MDRLNKIIKKVVSEATGDMTGSRGSYIPPVQPGLRPFSGESLQPFTKAVSDYKSPLVQYDSYDKQWDLRHDQIIELERTAAKIQDYIKHHPFSTFSDEDGNVINPQMNDKFNPNMKEKMAPFIEKVRFNEWVELTDDLLLEADSSVTSGIYNAPLEIGSYKWKNSELSPFIYDGNKYYNKKSLLNTLKKNVKRNVGVWEKDEKGSYKRDIDYPDTINEDLAVWFGKKKKPKGSSQPKGPWVNICRKVDGKHPPCGRGDTSKGAYPKCRAAGVAGKMSDSQKKAACAQKRRAEKKDPQRGKGQKPVMTSYKPKKNIKEDTTVLSIIRNLKSNLD